ncbi:DUF4230 domain-containing protein [Altererythrobacter aerius]|uniref:DUF4230 domain-containing protein n=1 Tax=Tsuneonella aeria TaxID=1837929 RepID=A0A6I4TBX7_9SPHN|nr:DUF4230 domain-containing protein [Tsuneonella aeria]MXO74841.1 DUF4230 domain-containing protein [Tsuneonella aeria]
MPLIIATHSIALGAGYYIAPRELFDNEVEHTGFLQTDTKKVLAATVDSLRLENQLVVWSYKGIATVKVDRSRWWIFSGRQTLIVPAVVTYHLDLFDLTLNQVEFDEKQKIVHVKLPRLKMGDIAFHPENAQTINGGILTYSEEQVEALRKLNYSNARRAFTKQAQGKGMVDAAKAQARKNIQNYFEIPLRIAGQPDVKVVATF